MYENSQYMLVTISTWLVICTNKYICYISENSSYWKKQKAAEISLNEKEGMHWLTHRDSRWCWPQAGQNPKFRQH